VLEDLKKKKEKREGEGRDAGREGGRKEEKRPKRALEVRLWPVAPHNVRSLEMSKIGKLLDNH
jgi:hypothetical protein